MCAKNLLILVILSVIFIVNILAVERPRKSKKDLLQVKTHKNLVCKSPFKRGDYKQRLNYSDLCRAFVDCETIVGDVEIWNVTYADLNLNEDCMPLNENETNSMQPFWFFESLNQVKTF